MEYTKSSFKGSDTWSDPDTLHIQIRAHHGMCLGYFIGKGYNGAFTRNMAACKELLETTNPQVTIVDHADHICNACPNNSGGTCISSNKSTGYDRAVLSLCGIPSGTVMHWLDFSSLVKEKVLDTGKRTSVCQDCRWNELCK